MIVSRVTAENINEMFFFQDEETLESLRTVANITHHSIMYAPKCLVIVSRQDYIDTFRVIYSSIYFKVKIMVSLKGIQIIEAFGFIIYFGYSYQIQQNVSTI